MARKPWWEGREPKFSVKFPAGFSADYIEWERKDTTWRKYLLDKVPCDLSVSDISNAIDAGKSSAMARVASKLTIEGVCTLLGDDTFHDGYGAISTDPGGWEDGLKERNLRYSDVWGDKADLGTAVHDAFENLCAGTVPSLSNYEAEVQPYIKAICGWFADNDPEVLHTEMLVGSREWKYAGRFDLLYELNGKRVLADLKTSKAIRPAYLIQLAGYSLALEECGYPPVDRMEVIWAKPDGSYKVIESKATHQDFINHIEAYSSYNSHKAYLEEAA